MYFEFQCSSCQKKLKVREETVGGKVRCPYCHTAQVVQPPAPPPVEMNPLAFLTEEHRPATAPGKSAPAEQQPAPPPATSHDEAVSGTDVSALKSGLVGLGIFVAIFAVLFPFRSYYIGGLLWNRGWVQFAEVFLASWAGAILFFKFRKLSAQNDSMLFDLLPDEISKDITAESCDKFVQNIRGLPVKPAESFLVNRVLRGLEHFHVLQNNGEVASRLAAQADIDSNEVDSSYTLVKVFVWAIPILGFIGTVQGIGHAVGSFSETMQAANDMSALKTSFNSVTGGLGTAFDTTLLALVLSIFIMFPMTSLLKSEQDLLNWVDEYCNENLLKRLKDGHAPSGPVATGDAKALQSAIDAAMASHHAELRTWTKKLEGIGEQLTQQVAKGWSKADEQMQARHTQTVKQLQQSVESMGEIAGRLKSMGDKQAETMTQLGDRTAKTQAEVAESMKRSAESLQKYVATLQEGLVSLNSVLADLGGKQVVIESAPRRGWFPFGRRNGK
jgi:biopolymer transport protein ExbB/TolQ/DNA-directed RNA polymerase subunit RPC12/RpoP